MRFFKEEDVRRMLPMPEAIRIVRDAFAEFAAGKASHQPRRRLFLPSGAVLHSMTGATERYCGAKVYATHASLGTASFTVLLYEAATAKPLAHLEADWLGQIRTGAVSGVAADVLLSDGPVDAACIGSGFQARSQIEALSAVRPIRKVFVWSRKPERRDAFAAEMGSALGLDIEVARSAEDAAAAADVLITATWSKDPVVAAEAVRPGTVVLAMGSNNPQRRELPGDLVRSARVVVEDRGACEQEAGDLLLAWEPGQWSQAVELKTLVGGGSGSAVRPDTVTVFKSVGIGLSDIAVAGWLYERHS
ncbi:MAG TPA: ornithine cyclodeaminase family protein [Bryobacteraceae bacterium]|nr:ornithine cyclodeaminase family protein [Bryobacteraceae bacterium]